MGLYLFPSPQMLSIWIAYGILSTFSIVFYSIAASRSRDHFLRYNIPRQKGLHFFGVHSMRLFFLIYLGSVLWTIALFGFFLWYLA